MSIYYMYNAFRFCRRGLISIFLFSSLPLFRKNVTAIWILSRCDCRVINKEALLVLYSIGTIVEKSQHQKRKR